VHSESEHAKWFSVTFAGPFMCAVQDLNIYFYNGYGRPLNRTLKTSTTGRHSYKQAWTGHCAVVLGVRHRHPFDEQRHPFKNKIKIKNSHQSYLIYYSFLLLVAVLKFFLQRTIIKTVVYRPKIQT